MNAGFPSAQFRFTSLASSEATAAAGLRLCFMCIIATENSLFGPRNKKQAHRETSKRSNEKTKCENDQI